MMSVDFVDEARKLMLNPQLFESYQPHEEDYAKVFQPEYVPRAREFFVKTFNTLTPEARKRSLTTPGNTDSTEVLVHKATVEELRNTSFLEQFDLPEDYNEVHKCIKPGTSILFIEFVSATASRGFDGFIRVGDHWSWFPKAYQLLDD